ncbi:hypothetical protein H9P43_001660 [Blastocladiella emersonii ATCC 22665]|nr:hypothetical protein H9P43_001660 [Blastocladiella emersonii ATCC 22665]
MPAPVAGPPAVAARLVYVPQAANLPERIFPLTKHTNTIGSAAHVDVRLVTPDMCAEQCTVVLWTGDSTAGVAIHNVGKAAFCVNTLPVPAGEHRILASGDLIEFGAGSVSVRRFRFELISGTTSAPGSPMSAPASATATTSPGLTAAQPRSALRLLSQTIPRRLSASPAPPSAAASPTTPSADAVAALLGTSATPTSSAAAPSGTPSRSASASVSKTPRRNISFGPPLRPEIIDSTLPPDSPVVRGEQSPGSLSGTPRSGPHTPASSPLASPRRVTTPRSILKPPREIDRTASTTAGLGSPSARPSPMLRRVLKSSVKRSPTAAASSFSRRVGGATPVPLAHSLLGLTQSSSSATATPSTIASATLATSDLSSAPVSSSPSRNGGVAASSPPSSPCPRTPRLVSTPSARSSPMPPSLGARSSPMPPSLGARSSPMPPSLGDRPAVPAAVIESLTPPSETVDDDAAAEASQPPPPPPEPPAVPDFAADAAGHAQPREDFPPDTQSSCGSQVEPEPETVAEPEPEIAPAAADPPTTATAATAAAPATFMSPVASPPRPAAPADPPSPTPARRAPLISRPQSPALLRTPDRVLASAIAAAALGGNTTPTKSPSRSPRHVVVVPSSRVPAIIRSSTASPLKRPRSHPTSPAPGDVSDGGGSDDDEAASENGSLAPMSPATKRRRRGLVPVPVVRVPVVKVAAAADPVAAPAARCRVPSS